MILRLQNLALLAALLVLPIPHSCLAEVVDISPDTPVSSLIASAKAARARGANSDALAYFDAVVDREPSDYLTLFQRGATYLSLGRNAQASTDFDGVLKIKPGFEGAMLQRAKIKARNGDWAAAKEDYKGVGSRAVQELAELEEAEGAAYLAVEAEQKQDWETCINQAGVAIMTAGTAVSMRQLRARCRFERGEVQEGVSDLAHVLQIHPGLVEPHLQMSSMLFYTLGDTDRGIAQLKKCLHSDPDSKPCKKLFREQKAVVKQIDKINSLFEARQFTSAAKLLTGSNAEDEPGLLAVIKANIASARDANMIHAHATSDQLYTTYLEKTCEAYQSTSNKKASTYCSETLKLNAHSLPGLLHQAQSQVDGSDYDGAIRTLTSAKEHHPGSQTVQQKLSEAHTLLKRSKTKDYYAILGLGRDADEREIKRAYRSLTKLHHPDKSVHRDGISKEAAEAKMAAINEAYEVLSDPDLKARFDRGDNPNDPLSQQGGHPFQGSPFGGGGAGGQHFFFQQGAGAGGGARQQFQFKAGGGGGGMPFPFG